MSEQQLQSIVQQAVAKALISQAATPKTSLEVLTELRAENARLKGKTAATPKPAPNQQLAADAKATHNPTAAGDAMLLALVKQFKSDPSKVKAGAIVGTFAVKVYGAVKTALRKRGMEPAVADAMGNQIIESAIERKVLSRGYTKSSGGMAILWDYKENPIDGKSYTRMPDDKANEIASAFGF